MGAVSRGKEEYEQQLAEKKRKELTADVGQSAGGANRADGKAAGQNQTADGVATHSEEALTKEAQIEKTVRPTWSGFGS